MAEASEEAAASRTRVTPSGVSAGDIGRIFREESGRSIAALIRAFGDIDVAADAVQEAFAVALRRWPTDGLPPSPGGWITTTARNRAIDGLRRRTREQELLAEADGLGSLSSIDRTSEEVRSVEDDLLRLIFTCCHPALAPEAQVALTLRLLGGLTTEEVAAAFLVQHGTMAKRLTRAKHKIKAAAIPYRVPEDHDLPQRLPPVLAVVYLIYNAGWNGRDAAAASLCLEAIRLARLLVELMPDENEVRGLLGLLLLTEARRQSRAGPDGRLVVLADQDRSHWDRALIDEGHAIIRECLRANRPGPYQVQAAIQAVHTDAPTFEATDWSQIVALYERLRELAPTSVVALNRAIAVGEVAGPTVALRLVNEIGPELDGYHAFHAARADLLARLGRSDEAVAAFARAVELAPTEAEREFLRSAGRSGLRSLTRS